jgi:serine/threonine protein kinase/class 3 adenylate cyclase
MPEKNQGTLAVLLQERARIDAELKRHRSEVTILFTDVVGSTAYYDRYGNTAGILLVQRLDEITNRVLKSFDGRWIKSTGDGSMAEFADPVQSVRAAIAMQQELFRKNQELTERERIQIRIGINMGEVFRKDGDVWGNAVNLAARVCAQCEPAQILVASSLRDLLFREPGLHINSLGVFSLKGKQQQEELFEVLWTEPHTYHSLREHLTEKAATGLLVKKDLTLIAGPEMPHLGGVFAGRYEILEELGVGGMGVVYKASDRETGEVLALKVLRLDVASDVAATERFKNELRVARRITHPKVCRVHDFGRASGTAYISMELVEGFTLRDLMDQNVMTREDYLQIVTELCEGLSEVHRQGAVHRDLKPSNVMVSTAQEVKLMDFGIAGFGNTGLTQAGFAIGTPRYMAPEQVRAGAVDSRTDVYSFGLILYEIAVGQAAFDGKTAWEVATKQLNEAPPLPRQLCPEVPYDVERIIMRCLQKDPAARYASAAEILIDLRVAMDALAIGTAGQELKSSQASALQAGETWLNPKDGQIYVWIPPGSFNMGALPTDAEATPVESPQHPVTVSRGYWIGQVPVTVEAYRLAAEKAGLSVPASPWKDTCPVTDVSWHDAVAHCNRVGGRLPTEAEWTYAARAGYAGPRYGEANKIAWFRVSPPGPRPVRGKEPNVWGLYDVLGNVWEWCADWFLEYTKDPATDPTGPETGEYKIIRGGSWDDHIRMARLSARSWRLPDHRSSTCGFRVVVDADTREQTTELIDPQFL